MDKENNFRFLPLGSFVKLKDRGDKSFLIVARALQKEEQGIHTKYRVADYPEGDKPNSKLLIVSDDEVLEVLHEGFIGEEEEFFLSDLIEKVNASEPVAVVKEIPEPDFTNLLGMGKKLVQPSIEPQSNENMSSENLKQKLKKDPFHKFRKGD